MHRLGANSVEKNSFAGLVSGNLTLIQIAEIAQKHRIKLPIPATCIIGVSDINNTKDRLIY